MNTPQKYAYYCTKCGKKEDLQSERVWDMPTIHGIISTHTHCGGTLEPIKVREARKKIDKVITTRQFEQAIANALNSMDL